MVDASEVPPLDLSNDPRMMALVQRIAGERQQAEAHFAHRIAALDATIRDEHHRATAGHAPIAGENGTCAVCGAIVHHVAVTERTA